MNKFTKIVLFLGISVVEIMFLFGFRVNPVYADTRVSGLIGRDTTWSIVDSPYLLTSDVTIPDGVTLTIDPGVRIESAPEAAGEYSDYNPALYVTGGHIDFAGSPTKHISIDNLGGIIVNGGSTENGSVTAKYTDITRGSGFSFDNSRGSISSSTITHSYSPLSMKDSIVSVEASEISNNDVGINIDSHQIIIIGAKNMDRFGTGGYGNALVLAPDIQASSSLSIHNSSIFGNSLGTIVNNGDFTVDATDNWWGSASGPPLSGVSSILGSVAYDPWLRTRPPLEIATTERSCCSNVIFIPGLEGTRLYTGRNQLWEPNRNKDVKGLFLDKNGSSTNKNIFSGDPIDKAFGIKEVYGKFMSFMDNLVVQGDINEWHTFGYDWRKSVPDVVTGIEKKKDNNESLLDSVIAMASTSRTGKVTLVAHSNGGLVAKYLVKTLKDMGKSDLIDAVISVAVPYLGTPEALPGLLHGDGTAILYGALASAANMKELGSNMSSAYGLLPSATYFTRIFSPTIVYASTSVNTYEGQKKFIANASGNSLLLTAAETLHSILDLFIWPSTIARWAIVGWNEATTKGIEYMKSTHTKDKTIMGDGTVVAPSASWNDGKVASIDMKAVSTLEDKKLKHMNILESSTTQKLVGDMIKNTNPDEPFPLPPGVSWGEPDYSKEGTFLTISTHSPVELHVYDAKGRHTGMIPKPPELIDNDFIVALYEENIPGSNFEAILDEQTGYYDTYIILPNENGEKFKVVINGTDFGSYYFESEQFQHGSTLDKVVYETGPVTPFMVATTTVGGNFANGIFVKLASTTPSVSVDIDGNGSVDYVSRPGGTGLPGNAIQQHIESLRITVNSLKISNARRVSLLKKIDRISELFIKGKLKQATKASTKLSKRLGHIKSKTASSAVVQDVADQIEIQLDDIFKIQ